MRSCSPVGKLYEIVSKECPVVSSELPPIDGDGIGWKDGYRWMREAAVRDDGQGERTAPNERTTYT